MALPPSFLSELKMRNPIADVIGTYVPVKRIGRNVKCKCPFHNETDASLVIYMDNQSFYCFGCGAAGDVITFIRKIENLDYMGAVNALAERSNMTVPEQDSRYAKMEQDRKKILAVNKASARFFFDQLQTKEGRKALTYLRNRGLSPKTITRFGLGYAPNSWDQMVGYLLKQGFGEQDLIQSAIAVKRSNGKGMYSQFRDRVMFPIINVRGEVIGFGGRILEGDGPKYLNSSDTPAFKKSRNLFAMNIAKASREKYFILAEGYMDVIALHQAGFDNAVACLGTALTKEQIYLLSGYTKEAILSYDSDGAGQTATKRAISLFDKSPVHVRVLQMEGAKDPDEYIQKYSAEKYALALRKSLAATDYLLLKIRENYDLQEPDGQVGYLREAVQCLKERSDPGERDIYAGKLAQELGVEKDTILLQIKGKNEYSGGQTGSKVGAASQKPGVLSGLEKQRNANKKVTKAEEALLAVIYRNDEFLPLIQERLSEDLFMTAVNRRLYTVLMEKIRKENGVELAGLNEELSEEEFSQFVFILNHEKDSALSRQGVLDYISVLQGEKNKKTDHDIRESEKDELNQYIQSLSSKKKRGK